MAISFKKLFMVAGAAIIISACTIYRLYGSLVFDPTAQPGSERDCSMDNPSCYQGRIAEYCASEAPTGTEGSFAGISGEYSLRHIVLNVRHGDRSAIHSIGDVDKQIKSFSADDIYVYI